MEEEEKLKQHKLSQDVSTIFAIIEHFAESCSNSATSLSR